MTAKHPVIDELIRICGDEGVLHERDQLLVYECDALPIAKGMPLAVVFPTQTQQVADCIRALNEHGVSIIPRGSGTGLAGGAVSYDEGVLMTTSRMTTIERIDLDNRFAVVQAGVRNTALSDAIADSGLHFSPDPSSQRASTIGGNAATNAGGINTLKHGVTTNHILAVELVTAEGDVILTRTPGLYDDTGPDLTGLVCGSEGVLGIITRLWCRLVPKPRHFRTVYAVFDSTEAACNTVSDVIATGITPTSMEMMDGAMVGVVEDAFAFGFPKDAQALLLIEIDGIDNVLDSQLQVVIDLAKQNGASELQSCSDPKRRAELWSARKRAFGAIGRISHSYCTQDACVPRSTLPDVMAKVQEIGRKYELNIPSVFHAGDGNIHPILLFDEDDPEQVQQVLRASEEILEYAISVGGTLTGEHGVGVEKLHLMSVMFNDATLQTFTKIKDTFDPQRWFNDGKLIPSDTLRIELIKTVGHNVPGGAHA